MLHIRLNQKENNSLYLSHFIKENIFEASKLNFKTISFHLNTSHVISLKKLNKYIKENKLNIKVFIYTPFKIPDNTKNYCDLLDIFELKFDAIKIFDLKL